MTKVLKELVRLRKEQELRQVDVAKKMRTTRQQVYNIETGRHGDPTIKTLEKYAKAIGAKITVTLS